MDNRYNAESQLSRNDPGLEVDRRHEGLQSVSRSGIRSWKPSKQETQGSYNQYSDKTEEHQKARRKNPCDLGPVAFALLVALITAIIVGAAVGGGVGGALSNRSSSPAFSSKASPPSSTVTVTRTATRSSPTAATSNIQNFVVTNPLDIGTLASDCPDLTTFTTSNLVINEEFDVTCGIDYSNSGLAVGGGIVADIVGIVAYTAEDCMEACAELNNFNAKWHFGVKCVGITWSRSLGSAWASLGANCWLKNGTAVNPDSSPGDLSASVVTG